MAENIRREKSRHSLASILVTVLLVLLKLVIMLGLLFGLYLFADGFLEFINHMRQILNADQLETLGRQLEIHRNFTTGTKLVIGVFTIVLMVGSFLIVMLKGIVKTIFK
ncbi:hypothetical protein [Streptococcus iniae]|uniref:Uncharacterized protein n=1 Tax=Streptococcus iniae TaxID=1346 RepID=A0A3L8GHC9_STRIN|nr:hypothetical protein [Streptococcus iniae]AGM99270.1 hypothetical protein K710_1511 [Streptococcus iniae SF1]AHY16205.1 hypothetical protein DQ08_07030 [Streptococcus iniae]AHY18069.1 hypothetical protein DW64_07015 [Streptococcus iniae]AJG26360.1 hypothetical protein SI82_07140 [Streptococcus iniae]APD32239.1 hypothetical protein BMF34_07065 [Streptococcus iniae]